MLSEGFDVPNIDTVILFGSHKSERDWIQKIGRALRQNQDIQEQQIANIYDIVVCYPHNHNPLSQESERYNTLMTLGEQI